MRHAEISRDTLETKIRVKIDLDGSGKSQLNTGIGFFSTTCSTRLPATAASTWRSSPLATCTSTATILSRMWASSPSARPSRRRSATRRGLTRYGHAYVPLDEALSRVVVDLSGRPGLEFEVPFTAGMIGALDTQLVYEFFQGFVNHAGVSLHIDNLKGRNAHHTSAKPSSRPSAARCAWR